MVAAGQRRSGVDAGDRNFRAHLLAGSHLIVPGARHEMLKEQDQYRKQFWAAFDAFVPGTPLY